MSCAIRQRIIYIRLWQRSRHLIQAREIRNEEKGQPCGHGHSFQEDMIQGSRIQGFEGSSENLKKQSTLDPLNPRSLGPLFAAFLRRPVTSEKGKDISPEKRNSPLLGVQGLRSPRSLLSCDQETLDRLATYFIYASLVAPPAHSSGIYDVAPCI
jgi:hypothetical protein